MIIVQFNKHFRVIFIAPSWAKFCRSQ